MINLKIYSYLCKPSYVIAKSISEWRLLKIPFKSIIFTQKRHIFFTGGAYYNLRKKIRRCRLCYLIGKKREKAIWSGEFSMA